MVDHRMVLRLHFHNTTLVQHPEPRSNATMLSIWVPFLLEFVLKRWHLVNRHISFLAICVDTK